MSDRRLWKLVRPYGGFCELNIRVSFQIVLVEYFARYPAARFNASLMQVEIPSSYSLFQGRAFSVNVLDPSPFPDPNAVSNKHAAGFRPASQVYGPSLRAPHCCDSSTNFDLVLSL